MAVGDTDDLLTRLRGALPPWFPDPANAPILTSILRGIADAFSAIYGQIGFAALQTRIATATGGWVDMIAWDFFGNRFVRRNGENDVSFQPRVILELLRPRQTRAAIVQMLTDLTGRTPHIAEAWNPRDCGGYGIPQMGGYGTGPGCCGSLAFNNQMFITAFRTPTQGIPLVAGYGTVGGGYGVGAIEYVDLSLITGPITDAEIYARIQQTIGAGTTAWVDISN